MRIGAHLMVVKGFSKPMKLKQKTTFCTKLLIENYSYEL